MFPLFSRGFPSEHGQPKKDGLAFGSLVATASWREIRGARQMAHWQSFFWALRPLGEMRLFGAVGGCSLYLAYDDFLVFNLGTDCSGLPRLNPGHLWGYCTSLGKMLAPQKGLIALEDIYR